MDAAGNVYISDTGNLRIRKVGTDNNINTVAGTGLQGFSGDRGPAISATFGRPLDLAFDAAGNLLVNDQSNARIRKIDLNGVITTIAGNGTTTTSGDHGPATAAGLNRPNGIATDSSGNLYVSEQIGQYIRKVDKNGIITTIAGTGAYGYSGDGSTAATAQISFPSQIVVDAQNDVYFSDTANCRVRVITPNGNINTIAGNGVCQFSGDGGSATAASFFFNHGLALDPAGNLYVADQANERVRVVSNAGTISTYAGNGTFRSVPDGTPPSGTVLYGPGGMAFDKAGNLYVSNAGGNTILKLTQNGVTKIAGLGAGGFTGDNGPALNAILDYPLGIAADPSGNIYFADNGTNRIRKISTQGIITTFAGSGVTPGYSGDNGPAAQATLNLPTGVAIDSKGSVYFSDQGNQRVRKVTTAGVISTVAGTGVAGYNCDNCSAITSQLNYPAGIAIDSSDNLYIAEVANERIRMVTPAGVISTVVGNGTFGSSGDGGPAIQSPLGGPFGLTLDSAGNIYIGEVYSNRLRMVTRSSGTIATLAGNLNAGFSGDGGPGINAALNSPESLAVDSAGNVYIGDFNNNRVREVLTAATSFVASPNVSLLSATAGGSLSTAQTLTLASSLPGLPYTVAALPQGSASWLQLSKTSGLMPDALSIRADPSTLSQGSYTATIVINAPGAVPPTQSLTLLLSVTPPLPGKLGISNQNLSFSLTPGASPASIQVSVSNQGSGNRSSSPRPLPPQPEATGCR